MTVYCEATAVHETRYDPDTNSSPVEAIAEAVAAVEGIDSMDLPPLYDHVDVEAVNRLLDGRNGAVVSETVIGFTVEGWNVLVRGDGHIAVLDPERPSEAAPVFGTVSAHSTDSRGRRQTSSTD